VLMIFVDTVVAGGNRDYRALRVAETVMAHRTGEDSADAQMCPRADHEQRRSDRFGNQNRPGSPE
jgi:hypothetical protein